MAFSTLRFLVLWSSLLSGLFGCQEAKQHAKQPNPSAPEGIKQTDKSEKEDQDDLDASPDKKKKPSDEEKKKKKSDDTSKKDKKDEDEDEDTKDDSKDESKNETKTEDDGVCEVNWLSTQTPMDVACYRSVEEVLETIPNIVKPYWVMMRDSDSAQPASLEKPRVIINDPSGRFFLSMATQDSEKDKIELAVFNDKEGRWLFAGFDFSEEKTIVDEESCKSCHGQTPHPIWTGYRTWPGSFGDEDNLKADEIARLRMMVQAPEGIEKYITLSNDYSSTQGQTIRPAVRYGESGNNQILNFTIGRQVSRGLVKKIFDEKKPTTAELLPLLHASVCSRSLNSFSSELQKLGYNYADFYSFHRIDRNPQRMWLGFAFIETLLSIPLFQMMIENDEQFKSDYSDVANMLESTRANMMTLETEDIHQHLMGNSGWYDFDFNWWNAVYLNNLSQNGDICQRIANQM